MAFSKFGKTSFFSRGTAESALEFNKAQIFAFGKKILCINMTQLQLVNVALKKRKPATFTYP